MSALEIHYELPLAIVIAGLLLTLSLRVVLAIARRGAARRTRELLRTHGAEVLDEGAQGGGGQRGS